MHANQIKNDLLNSEQGSMRYRRGIIAVSLAGMAAMAAVALRQTGLLPKLPDLPIDGFDSERVILSDVAFALGAPDATISLTSMAANITLAAAGPANRAVEMPWLPVAATAKAGAESVVSLWYLRHEKSWCSYCLVAALANFAVFGLSLLETRQALVHDRGRA